MIRKPVLEALVKLFQEDLQNTESTTRELQPTPRKGFATVISGIRRCGKSTLAKQLVAGKTVYYFHFENVQLATFDQKDFAKLDETFKEILGETDIYLLDEIQNIPGWEIFVRQLVDAKNNVIITGSNATMLSRELGTRLTGRNLRYELYPFSFTEYLKFSKKIASLEAFDQYFNEGGFPDHLKESNLDILRNLFEDIFYRDILVRNDIRREAELKQFVAFISSNIGVKVSNNRLKNLLGLGSANTVAQFMHAAEQAYLFFSISKYNPSLSVQQKNPKKTYCVDNALLRLNAFAFSENKGRYLENCVYMHLRRTGKETYYHEDKHECDFLTKEGLKIMQAIQVCYELHDENEEREINGLLEACTKHNLKEGLLLTHNQDDTLEHEGIRILVQPVWKWLVEQKNKPHRK